MSCISSFQRFLKTVLFFSFVTAFSGCIYLVVGSVGALGGYVVSPDTVEGVITGYERQEAWDESIEVISIMGVILEKNEAGGIIIAKIHGAKVTITVLRMSETSVKMTIKARKAFLPRIKVAQDVYIKIESQLNK